LERQFIKTVANTAISDRFCCLRQAKTNIPMNFFTSAQTRVIKTAWVPILTTLLIQVLLFKIRLLYPQMLDRNSVAMISSLLVFISIFTWELLMRQKRRQALFLGLIMLAGYGLYFFAGRSVDHSGIGAGWWLTPLYWTVSFGIQSARHNFLQTKTGWKAVLITAVIYSYPAWLSSPVFNFLKMEHNISETTWLYIRCLNVLSVTGSICLTTFMVENYFNITTYAQQLKSRIQVLDRTEYLLLFITAYVILLANTSEVLNIFRFMSDDLRYVKEYNYQSLALLVVYFINMVVHIVWALAGAYFIRNIIVSRSLTTRTNHQFYYLLHYLPVLNIIPVVIMAGTATKHTTTAENAIAYFEGDRESMSVVVIFSCAGMAFVSIFIDYSLFKRAATEVFGIAVLLRISRVLMFMLIRKSKALLYVLIAMNVLVLLLLIRTDFFRYEFMALSTVLLLFYFLTELFYPALHGQDAVTYKETLQPEAVAVT
jgi:hypothetical protein